MNNLVAAKKSFLNLNLTMKPLETCMRQSLSHCYLTCSLSMVCNNMIRTVFVCLKTVLSSFFYFDGFYLLMVKINCTIVI